MIRLRTDRLLLRDLTLADADFVYEIIGSKAGVPNFPRTFSRTEAEQWIEKSVDRQAEFGAAFWLAERRADRAPVGFYGPLVQSIAGAPFYEVGWYTHPAYRNMGYAREAGLACLEWAFDHFNTDRVGALILPNNRPSISVAESLGMRPGEMVMHANLPHVAYSVSRSTTR